MDKKSKYHVTEHARSKGNTRNTIVYVSIIFERTDVPRMQVVLSIDLTGHLTANFIGRQLVKP